MVISRTPPVRIPEIGHPFVCPNCIRKMRKSVKITLEGQSTMNAYTFYLNLFDYEGWLRSWTK